MDQVPETNQPAIPQEIRSLKDLIDAATGRNLPISDILKDSEEPSTVDIVPYPYLAIVGQKEMKLALMLSLINPNLGGVLLLGPRGTGKTTAVRSLLNLLPMVERSACVYGCLPEDIEYGGMDAVCPECAQKYAQSLSLTRKDIVRMVEIPLNSTIDDVVGGLDERTNHPERYKVKKGLLAQADQNILYIDEVNLLPDNITDAILDASAQGRYTLRRGMVSASYRSRFTLIGSMNPEEGRLRPQIMDRFGLRVIVQRLDTMEERMEAYRRVHTYSNNPIILSAEYASETAFIQKEILRARGRCRNIVLDEETASFGISLIQELKIDSLRADITLFEAARAYCAADNRDTVEISDIIAVTPMALRLRRSSFMDEYFNRQLSEEHEIERVLEQVQNQDQA
jgi:magnesium chelatase subunit I